MTLLNMFKDNFEFLATIIWRKSRNYFFFHEINPDLFRERPSWFTVMTIVLIKS